MKTFKPSLALLAFAMLAAGSAYAADPAMVSGDMLQGHNGMTLYVFDKDPAGGGKSLCNGPCTANWPPLYAEAGAMAHGDFSPIARDDGKMQWSFKGKPLYFWSKDVKPGDRAGDGFNNVWHVARP